MKNACKGLLFISLFALVLAGCGGGGGGTTAGTGSALTVSGTVGSGYSTAGVSKAAADTPVDMVIAIPIERGSLAGWSMPSSLSADIDNSGSFSLPLATDRDWLLLLIDNSISGPGRYVGSVALNTGTDLLLNLPATDAGISTLDLGTLSSLGMNAVSNSIVNGVDFNMTADQLTAMAKTSDIFHNAMNMVNNYDPATGIWREMRPNFFWNGVTAALTSYTDPDSYSFTGNGGINFQLDTNSTQVSMANICDRSVVVEFVPTVDATDKSGNIWNATNPISSASISNCQTINTDYQETFGSEFYASDAFGDIPGQTISYGMQTYFGTMPEGLWEWKVDGVTVGEFDVAVVSPPVTAGGKPKGFVPSFKLTVDGATKEITAIDVQWYYYNEGTSQYVGPLDSSYLGVLEHFIGSAEVTFDVTYLENRLKWDCYFDPVTTTHIVPSVGIPSDGKGGGCDASTDTWYYNDPSHPETNTGLNGFFSTGGFGYYFQFFVP